MSVEYKTGSGSKIVMHSDPMDFEFEMPISTASAYNIKERKFTGDNVKDIINYFNIEEYEWDGEYLFFTLDDCPIVAKVGDVIYMDEYSVGVRDCYTSNTEYMKTLTNQQLTNICCGRDMDDDGGKFK